MHTHGSISSLGRRKLLQLALDDARRFVRLAIANIEKLSIAMKPSPVGSKLLSIYAIVFAGVVPGALLVTATVNGVISLPYAFGNIALRIAIIYFGVRVFLGDYSATIAFALLVALNYLGLTTINVWSMNDLPPDSRATQMAIPRMIRGVLFASVYIWYYLLRTRTALGFVSVSRNGNVGGPI